MAGQDDREDNARLASSGSAPAAGAPEPLDAAAPAPAANDAGAAASYEAPAASKPSGDEPAASKPEADEAAQAAGSEPKRGMSELGKRVITGFVYSVTISACLLVSNLTTMIIVAYLSAMCATEFYRMMHIDGKLPNDMLGIICSLLYPVVYYFGHLTYVIVLTMLFMGVLLVWYVFSPRNRITDLALTMFGALYCGLMLAALLAIRMSIPGIEGGILAFGVALSVWGNDSLAYLIGSRFGKHKLAPKISPKKSWEGFIAGVLGSLLVWMLIPLFVPRLSFGLAAVAGVVCGVTDVFGDFVESRIKRGAGVKDSGTALPGHGGYLDRCDSMIFVSMVAFFTLVFGGIV